MVITRLDRFALTTSKGTELIKELLKKGVKIHVLNMRLIEDIATGRLILNIMNSSAEFEQGMIVERTQDSKTIAKQRENFREDRHKFSKKHIEEALNLLKIYSYVKVEERTGISKSTLSRAKK